MKCTEKKCDGEFSLDHPATYIMTGCESTSPAYACTKCGRLHSHSGQPFNRRGGDKVFFIKGKLVHKDINGNILQF